MIKTYKTKRIIVLILLLVTISFIFYNSFLPGDDSKELSSGVYVLIKPFLEKILPNTDGELVVRKLAHFTEFAALSIELSYLYLSKNDGVYKVLLFGLIVALTDETIQIFSKRGTSVIDVWIDFLGVITTLIIHKLLQNKNEKLSQRD